MNRSFFLAFFSLASIVFLANAVFLANPATAVDVVTPQPDAPRYQLSNIRQETDRFGKPVLSIDFKRTKEGKGSVSVRGKSKDGDLSISASISSSQDSGTISLSSFFSTRNTRINDVEIFLAKSHRIGARKYVYAMVSNAVRIGNPGEPTKTRPWTAQEKSDLAEFRRIMSDPNAHKPDKSYPVQTAVPEGSEFVPSTAKVVDGVKLQASYNQKWYPITVLSENEDGTINVHWDDYGADFDVAMNRGELIIESAALAKLDQHPATKFPTTHSHASDTPSQSQSLMTQSLFPRT